MTQRINLEFRKDLTMLAGNSFGRDTYIQQVKGIIDYSNDCIEIVLPERIDFVASSFNQGFFKDIISKIGIKGIKDKIEVISSIQDINEKIIKNLNL